MTTPVAAPFLVQRATSADLDAVRALLAQCHLPEDSVEVAMQNAFVAHHDKRIIGCIALESYGHAGLLRSLAVLPEQRGRRIGEALHIAALEHARTMGIVHLYLLTDSAEAFFARRGFERVERSSAPADLRQHPQFLTACPASAACMRRTLAG